MYLGICNEYPTIHNGQGLSFVCDMYRYVWKSFRMTAISYQIAWPSTSAFMTISFETSEVWHPTKLQELSSLQFVAWVLHRNFRALICEIVSKKVLTSLRGYDGCNLWCKTIQIAELQYFLGNPFVVGFGVWTGSGFANVRHQGMPVKSCWFSVGVVRWITCNDQHWKSIYLITIIHLEKVFPPTQLFHKRIIFPLPQLKSRETLRSFLLMLIKLCFQIAEKTKLRTFCIWKACRVSL